MNKRLFFGVSLICVLLICVISFASVGIDNIKIESIKLDKTGANGKLKKLSLDTKPPEVPGKLTIFKVVDLGISTADVKELAHKLNINGEVKQGHGTSDFKVEDSENGKKLVVDKETGTYLYTTKNYLKSEPIKNVLSNEKYRQIAEEYLKEKGLLKQSFYYKSTMKDTFTTVKENGNEVTLPYNISVNFIRDLNGYRWSGVGPRITVFMGNNAEITGVFYQSREVEKYKEFPIANPQQALEQVENGKAAVYMDNRPRVTSGKVESIKLHYKNRPVGYNQKYIIPYYHLRGKTKEGNDFLAITRAIPEKYVEIVEPKTDYELPPKSNEDNIPDEKE